MDVCDCDLLDVSAYAKYNDNYGYILSVINVFLKYLHKIPLNTKIGPSVLGPFGLYLMTLKIREYVPYGYALISARNF